MPKLIDLSQQPRPIARTPGRVVAQQPVVSDARARGVLSFGAAVESVGNRLAKQQAIEEERLNTLRAEDAYTQLKQRQLELTYGEGEGFSNLTGVDAVSRPLLKDWGQKFDDAERVITQGLSNDPQREKFKRRADVSRIQYQEDILRHQAAQKDAYANHVYKSTIDFETQNAVSNWATSRAVDSALERINAAVDEQAEQQGWTDEARLAEQRVHSSKVYTSVAKRIIDESPTMGRAYMEQHEDDIDPLNYVALRKAYVSAADRIDRLSDKQFKETQDRFEESRLIQILEAGEDAPDESVIINDLANQSITRQAFERLTKALETDPTEDDLLSVMVLDRLAADGDSAVISGIIAAVDQEDLTKDTGLEIYRRYLQSKEEGGLFSQEDVQWGEDIVDQKIGGVRDIAAVLGNTESARVINAKKEYRRRIETARATNPNANAEKIAEQVVVDFQQAPPSPTTLERPRYLVGPRADPDIPATEAATVAAVDRGEILGREPARQFRLLEEIAELIRRRGLP